MACAAPPVQLGHRGQPDRGVPGLQPPLRPQHADQLIIGQPAKPGSDSALGEPGQRRTRRHPVQRPPGREPGPATPGRGSLGRLPPCVNPAPSASPSTTSLIWSSVSPASGSARGSSSSATHHGSSSVAPGSQPSSAAANDSTAAAIRAAAAAPATVWAGRVTGRLLPPSRS